MTLVEQLAGRQVIPVAEAATLLNVCRQTLYRAMADGSVPNVGIGGTFRVPAWFLLKTLSPPK